MTNVVSKINRRNLIIECCMALGVFALAYYWSSNSVTAVGKFVSSFNVVVSCVTIPYYITNRFLVPKFLLTRRYLLFAGGLVLLLVVNPFISFFIGSLVRYFLLGVPFHYEPGTFSRSIYVLLWNTILAAAMGIGLKLMAVYYSTEKKMAALEQQKTQAELEFLKSQINPHFLFNVMNTIYFQIDKENEEARKSVDGFAQLLRYQLQMSGNSEVLIEKEIDFIWNYCALQKLRLNDNVAFSLDIDPSLKGFYIMPLIIIPIVENAFKYVSSRNLPLKNKIAITLGYHAPNILQIQSFNTIDKMPADYAPTETKNSSGGIGLINLKRRLALVYPDRHSLEIEKTDTYYSITLRVEIPAR